LSDAPILVTAAILQKGGKVFAARRAPGKHLAGFWEFPGGKLEGPESPQDCLERELEEEFGVKTAVGTFLAENLHDYGEKVVHLLAYQVDHIGGELQLRDHDKVAWIEPEALMTLKWAPADVPLVEHYLAVTRTARFYDQHAEAYCDETSNFDMTASYGPFLDRLPAHGHILDLGCGSGRDTKAFLDRGFSVTAIDACSSIAKLAAAYTGQTVTTQSVHELTEIAVFDAV
jgi:mutator protein MutT